VLAISFASFQVYCYEFMTYKLRERSPSAT
jgi:hypothetical protein